MKNEEVRMKNNSYMTGSDKTLIMNGSNYTDLLHNIGDELERGRRQVVSAVNSAMVETYWHIGQHIVEYEQKGNEKADYGSQLLTKLSKDLTILYGNGFSVSNIYRMRELYIDYPIFATVSRKLTWSHYIELLKIEDPLERSFYETSTAKHIILLFREKYRKKTRTKKCATLSHKFETNPDVFI